MSYSSHIQTVLSAPESHRILLLSFPFQAVLHCLLKQGNEKLLAGFTAGGELHPAPKNVFCYGCSIDLFCRICKSFFPAFSRCGGTLPESVLLAFRPSGRTYFHGKVTMPYT